MLEPIPNFLHNSEIENLQNAVFALFEQRPLSGVDFAKSLRGWALQSDTGMEMDGFKGWEYSESKTGSHGRLALSELKTAITEGYSLDISHNQETPICTPIWKSLIDRLRGLGLTVRRARILCMPPKSEVPKHRDGPPGGYFVRFFLPVLTNQNSGMEIDGKVYHFPADGTGWFFDATKPHRVWNNGDAERVHLVCTIWDPAGATKNFSCSQEVLQEEFKKENKMKLIASL